MKKSVKYSDLMVSNTCFIFSMARTNRRRKFANERKGFNPTYLPRLAFFKALITQSPLNLLVYINTTFSYSLASL